MRLLLHAHERVGGSAQPLCSLPYTHPWLHPSLVCARWLEASGGGMRRPCAAVPLLSPVEVRLSPILDGCDARGGRVRRRLPRRTPPLGRLAASIAGALGPTLQPLSRPCAALAALGGSARGRVASRMRSAVHVHGCVGMRVQPLCDLPCTRPRLDPSRVCASWLQPRRGIARRPCRSCAPSRARPSMCSAFYDVFFAMWTDVM